LHMTASQASTLWRGDMAAMRDVSAASSAWSGVPRNDAFDASDAASATSSWGNDTAGGGGIGVAAGAGADWVVPGAAVGAWAGA
jgi:hypothetical protein